MFVKFIRFSLISVLIIGWIFSGWPQIWSDPSFPPVVIKALADEGIKTYSFASDVEGWSNIACGAAGASCSWQSGDGSPANGSLEESETRKGKSGTWTWQISGITWEDLGIPAGSTVTAVDGSYNHRMSTCVTCGTANTSGDLLIRNSDDSATITTLETALSYSGATSWAARNTTGVQSVGASYQASNTALIIRLSGFLSTPNTNGAQAILRQDEISLTITYTPTVVSAPTVTTASTTNVEATTATGNGNITATGGEDASAWGIVYNTTGNPTTADSVAAGSGSGGAGAFTASLSSLSPGTTYYLKAYATNSGGTSYGAEEIILTKPAAPTSVSATDGTDATKVVVTWATSTGATGYKVYEGANLLDTLGDVATYDDTGAPAPTITAGSASASDGTNINHVSLSLSGQSANNGASRTYKVVAVNATGDSADSATDTGYRGPGTLTYQWQRSASDSDASYSNIAGATTASYNDTGAPSDGSGRYYRAVLDATGATQQTSATDRGYRATPVISVTIGEGEDSFSYGNIDPGMSSSTLPLFGGAGITVTNNGNVTETFYIKGQDTACPWTLATATSSDQYVHRFCNDTADDCSVPPTNYLALTTNELDNTLASSVGASNSVKLQLQISVPDPSSCFVPQNASVSIVAVEA